MSLSNPVGTLVSANAGPFAAEARALLASLPHSRAWVYYSRPGPHKRSCRTGVCHNCETGLIAGAVDYDPDPGEPPADGSTLLCCSHPLERLVLDL